MLWGFLIQSDPVCCHNIISSWWEKGRYPAECFVGFFPVEILQGLVSGSLGGTLGQPISSPAEQEVMAGPISLPRRAETFGGFDCHQLNASKGKPSIIPLQFTLIAPSSVPSSVTVFMRVFSTQEFLPESCSPGTVSFLSLFLS